MEKWHFRKPSYPCTCKQRGWWDSFVTGYQRHCLVHSTFAHSIFGYQRFDCNIIEPLHTYCANKQPYTYSQNGSKSCSKTFLPLTTFWQTRTTDAWVERQVVPPLVDDTSFGSSRSWTRRALAAAIRILVRRTELAWSVHSRFHSRVTRGTRFIAGIRWQRHGFG